MRAGSDTAAEAGEERPGPAPGALRRRRGGEVTAPWPGSEAPPAASPSRERNNGAKGRKRGGAPVTPAPPPPPPPVHRRSTYPPPEPGAKLQRLARCGDWRARRTRARPPRPSRLPALGAAGPR
ncbi:hypothetical protein KIL84_018379 [Mauremys mutica]|uniref:Uncharacterized protein n=1 Tax=Mauremys mutica TaxID=74926 RepID=A0A9D3XUN9_9SAUR|nr:hypothetical protein KIL84_018379 [Mauremys mutica]